MKKMKKMMPCRLTPPINIKREEMVFDSTMRFHPPPPLGGALCLVAVVQLPAGSWGCTPLHPAGLSLGLRRVGRRRRPRNGGVPREFRDPAAA